MRIYSEKLNNDMRFNNEHLMNFTVYILLYCFTNLNSAIGTSRSASLATFAALRVDVLIKTLAKCGVKMPR